MRDVDINNTKKKFNQIRSKLVIPQIMLDEDHTQSEEHKMNNDDDDFEEFKEYFGKSRSEIKFN